LKKRVLFCISNLNIGGVERHVIDQIPYLQKFDQDIEYAVCAFNGGSFEIEAREKIENSGAKLILLNRKGRWDVKFLFDLRRVVRDFQPNIVHAHNFGACFWIRILLRSLTQIIICHYGGISQVTRYWSRFLERMLLSRTDVCVFNSFATQRVFENAISFPVKKIVIHNGLDCEKYKYDALDHDCHDAGYPFQLLSLGRITAIKACDIQLLALHELKKRGRHVQLVMVGDGDSLPALKQMAEELDISSLVQFEGFQKNVEYYYRRANLFLVTSYHETFCLSLCEAMLFKLVCISAATGGPTEIINHGENGYFVPCDIRLPDDIMPKWRPMIYHGNSGNLEKPMGISVSRLVEQIEYIIDNYGGLDRMRDRAQKTVLEKFSMERHCHSLIALYRELLNC